MVNMVRGKDNSTPKHQGNSLNSFMWGAIVGSGLTYILSQKKGRALLHDISENGIEALRGILDSENLEGWKDKMYDHFNKDQESPRKVKSSPAVAQPRKRLFRGLKRK